MADIANSTVFTNGVVSCGTSDLLRQAFQEVVDDDDNENEFVAFLQSDGDESQTIHLTHAQASALRLTFQVDSVDEPPDNITYQQVRNGVLGDIASSGLENEESSPPSNDPMETVNFPSESNTSVDGIVKVNCSQLQEWTSSEGPPEQVLENEQIAIEALEMSNSEEQIFNQFSNDAGNMQKIYVQSSSEGNDSERLNIQENNTRFSLEEVLPQTLSQNNVRNSQAQILQRLPIILPSSQFMIKPAQTVLKSTKNIRILPSTNKMANVNISALTNTNGQNSILLPKGALLNTLSPQMMKATPITTQLLNGRTLSTQLMNTSQILSPGCDYQNKNGNGSVNGANSRCVQTLINTPIRLSPMVKTASGIIQRSNGQQFIMPTLKATQDGNAVVKSLQGSNGKSAIAGQYLKSVQIPAQMLRNAAFVKNSSGVAVSTVKITGGTNSPMIFRTASLLKGQDVKTATTTPTTTVSSVLRTPAQSPSTPISILKPQTKVTFNNSSRIVAATCPNVSTNVKNHVQNAGRFGQKAVSMNETNERLKTLQNGIKQQRVNEAAVATARIVKRARVAGLENPVALTAEQTDTTKPLGSSENPIQIVQQGHTFHSMQRLTQSQLKQIAHVLQQRSQEAAMPNEKIVYRVVFPEELDLRMRNPSSNLLKARGGKRGRPKKTAVRPPVPATKIPTLADEEHDDSKDDRKKVVARTRSGRLSRPPRHMVRDYKHLHHMDFTQPDLDDSDGGYSDYNTNAEKLENEDSPKELLSGLEVPKRKISDHFRCPTCNKIYLGRTRMARHFEMHPDHGSPEQLPPPTPDPELKRAIPQDPLKRKGKKRGPWAYVTPEAKSERRQVKLKEAISVCENPEIINIAAKPVLNAQSLFDLLVLKSENNVRNFLTELQELMSKIRQQVGTMLHSIDAEKDNTDVVNLNEESLCDALGLEPGLYKINNEAFRKAENNFTSDMIMNSSIDEEPPLKIQKTLIVEECKEMLEERMSSGFSESSDMSVSDFLNERKNETMQSPNCPEVLSALTLMPRNSSPLCSSEVTKSNNGMSLLISNPEIQIQISDNPGFQKIDINSSKSQQPSYRKIETLKDGFTKLSDSLELSNCSTVFTKLDGNYEQPKTLQQAFIKLEPMEQSFKLENSTVSAYQKDNCHANGFESMETGSENFAKGPHKLISKIVPLGELAGMSIKAEPEGSGPKMLRPNCKISDSLILQDSVPIMSDASIFGSTDNLDMSKIPSYDHLDILTNGGVMDKHHLMMDEKLVEQLHLVDQSNLVDELVSERLKNIMPDNILDNNLIPNNPNLDTDLDFEALSEEFNRNTRS